MDAVRSRYAAIRAVVAHRGGAAACQRTAVLVEALQGIVVKGVASGAISVPQTPEETARLLNQWIMAARDAAIRVGRENLQEAARFEGEARALTHQLEATGAGNVIAFPEVPKAPKGRVRRRKKTAPAGE